MNKSLIVSVLLVSCSQAQETSSNTRSSAEVVQDASLIVSTNQLDESPTIQKIDKGLKELREADRVLEECVMPAFGLYVKTQTCDMPPSICTLVD